MMKKYALIFNFITVFIFLILISLFINLQFSTPYLYAYDSYQTIGFSNQINETGLLSINMQKPVAIDTIRNPTGYYQAISLNHLFLSYLTGLDLIISGKILIVLIFCLLNLTFFLFLKKYFNNNYLILIGIYFLNFIPVLIYRYSFFVQENLALIIFFLLIFFLLYYKKTELLLILFPYILAIHPKITFYFVPVLILIILINKMYQPLTYLIILLCSLPFLEPVFHIFKFYFENKGANYVLLTPTTSIIDFDIVVSLTNIFSILLILSIFILALKSVQKKNLEKKYLIMLSWIILSLVLIFVGPKLNFPINRTLTYYAITLPLLLIVFLNQLRLSLKKLTFVIILSLIIILIPLFFYQSSFSRPFIGWGAQEKEAMLYLKEELLKLESKDSYVILTPEYSLPFAYGHKNIEFDELKISKLFNQSVDDLGYSLKSEYSNRTVYLILGSWSCRTLREKKIVKYYCEHDNIFYLADKIKIIKL